MNMMKRRVCMGSTTAMRTRVIQPIVADIKGVITSDGAVDFAII